MSEEWRSIRGYPHYNVSSLGRVRFLGRDRKVSDSMGRVYVCRHKPRLRKITKTEGRYAVVTIYNDDGRLTAEVHRLVARVFHGRCPSGQEVRHKNGDKYDNRAANLCYGTRAENIADKVRHGTQLRGAQAPNSKLTERQVRAIKAAASKGVPQIRLSEKYGVGPMQVSRIVRGLRWAHIAEVRQ